MSAWFSIQSFITIKLISCFAVNYSCSWTKSNIYFSQFKSTQQQNVTMKEELIKKEIWCNTLKLINGTWCCWIFLTEEMRVSTCDHILEEKNSNDRKANLHDGLELRLLDKDWTKGWKLTSDSLRVERCLYLATWGRWRHRTAQSVPIH